MRLHLCKEVVDGIVAGDIAFLYKGCADALGQRLDTLLENFARIGETQFGAFLMQRLGNAPCN